MSATCNRLKHVQCVLFMSGWKVSLSSKMETVWEFAFLSVNWVIKYCFKMLQVEAAHGPGFSQIPPSWRRTRASQAEELHDNQRKRSQRNANHLVFTLFVLIFHAFSICFNMFHHFVCFNMFQWPIWLCLLLFDAAKNDGSRDFVCLLSAPQCRQWLHPHRPSWHRSGQLSQPWRFLNSVHQGSCLAKHLGIIE